MHPFTETEIHEFTQLDARKSMLYVKLENGYETMLQLAHLVKAPLAAAIRDRFANEDSHLVHTLLNRLDPGLSDHGRMTYNDAQSICREWMKRSDALSESEIEDAKLAILDSNGTRRATLEQRGIPVRPLSHALYLELVAGYLVGHYNRTPDGAEAEVMLWEGFLGHWKADGWSVADAAEAIAPVLLIRTTVPMARVK